MNEEIQVSIFVYYSSYTFTFMSLEKELIINIQFQVLSCNWHIRYEYSFQQRAPYLEFNESSCENEKEMLSRESCK